MRLQFCREKQKECKHLINTVLCCKYMRGETDTAWGNTVWVFSIVWLNNLSDVLLMYCWAIETVCTRIYNIWFRLCHCSNWYVLSLQREKKHTSWSKWNVKVHGNVIFHLNSTEKYLLLCLHFPSPIYSFLSEIVLYIIFFFSVDP